MVAGIACWIGRASTVRVGDALSRDNHDPALETGDWLPPLDTAPKPDWTQRHTLPARDGADVFSGLRGAGDAPKQPP